MNVHARDVERRFAFVLHLVMVDHRALARDHFRHGIHEVRLTRGADVVLDDARLAAVARNDERPGVHEHRACRFPRRDEHNLERLLEDDAVRDVHEGAVRRERGVERDERAVAELRQLPEVALDDIGALGERGRQ
jgi:hypothetical protein